jgi:hypothetical protein
VCIQKKLGSLLSSPVFCGSDVSILKVVSMDSGSVVLHSFWESYLLELHHLLGAGLGLPRYIIS